MLRVILAAFCVTFLYWHKNVYIQSAESCGSGCRPSWKRRGSKCLTWNPKWQTVSRVFPTAPECNIIHEPCCWPRPFVVGRDRLCWCQKVTQASFCNRLLSQLSAWTSTSRRCRNVFRARVSGPPVAVALSLKNSRNLFALASFADNNRVSTPSLKSHLDHAC